MNASFCRNTFLQRGRENWSELIEKINGAKCSKRTETTARLQKNTKKKCTASGGVNTCSKCVIPRNKLCKSYHVSFSFHLQSCFIFYGHITENSNKISTLQYMQFYLILYLNKLPHQSPLPLRI